jgi:hypothetical protein
VETFLFDNHSWLFPTASGHEYDEVRKILGRHFKIEADEVAIVGSAKYGFSLSPEKNFRQFDTEMSDVDMVVISRPLFSSTWHFLRRAYYNGNTTIKKMYEGDVFRRFIMLGTDDPIESEYLRDTMKMVDQVRRVATTQLGISQSLKLRIYQSWSDAMAYHVWSAQKLGEAHGIK